MRVLSFGPELAVTVNDFDSHGARAVHLAEGRGDAHVYAIHVEAGGVIGPHPAAFGELFVVVSGRGWVAGEDGARHALGPGEAAFLARGELHSKGSDDGMTAIMVQVRELAGRR